MNKPSCTDGIKKHGPSWLRARGGWVWTAVFACLGILKAQALVGFDSPVVVTQVPREVKLPPADWNMAGLIRSDWFEGARIVVVSPEGQVRVLSDGFYSACDPSLSFDAKRLLFSGKKEKQARWRIWEIGIGGQNLRAVSPENQEARSPIYAATLFTLDSPGPWFTLVYAVRENIVSESGGLSGSSLFNVKFDGTEPRRLTYNPNHNLDPFQMWDGRVLYAAERYPVEPGAQTGRVGLHSVSIVGTEMIDYGGEGGRRIQHMPCATEQRCVLFVENDEAEYDGAGQLACVWEQRPHRTYKALTSDPAWRYLHPSPWKGNRVLVSRRPANRQATCGVFCYDADTGECQAIFDSPDYHDVQAQAVLPRALPDGHSTVVEPTKYTNGVFYALNCYDTDEKISPHAAKGLFKRVRIIEGMPRNSGEMMASSSSNNLAASPLQRPFVARRLLGEAPIEADGSFHIEVPADTPVLIQTLDDRGLALGTCGWVWLKPKETRGCVGCHEDPELIPENNFVAALRRPASLVSPPPSQRRSLGFKESVAPILKRRCASAGCHGMTDSPLYMPLMSDKPAAQDMEQAYLTLRSAVEGGPGSPSPVPQRGKYVDAGRARTSPLVWRLFGTDTSRPWDRPASQADAPARKVRLMPPPDKGGPLSEEEIRVLVQWIDAGAAWEAVRETEADPSATNLKESAH